MGMCMSENQLRPVQLEANRQGLWRVVLEFDAGDELAEAAMRQGCEALASIDRALAFRIVAKQTGQPLLTYSAKHGWNIK